jgi:hypothetical protein
MILKMLFETPLRPRVISFESALLSRDDKLACAANLAREGYNYLTLDRDTIAVSEALAPAATPEDCAVG